MQLSTIPQDDKLRVILDGPRFEAKSATDFKDRMLEILQVEGKPLVLDLSAVEFMDSTALGALVAVYKQARQGLGLQISGVHPNVLSLFQLTRMDKIFTILP